MGALLSKSKPPPPAMVPTDTVVPFNFMDKQQIFQDLTMALTFRFDAVFDAVRLREALDRLLEIGEWRRLGGRVRRDAEGNLSYHVPEEYDEKRPGVAWSHVELDMSISEHDVASKLPSISPTEKDQPQFFSGLTDLASLAEPTNMPRKASDWIDTDKPPLLIHVVSFKDATLITVNWNHSLTDLLGLSSFLRAWTAVLAGREDEVPAFFPEDPLEKLSAQPSAAKERYVLYDWSITGIRMVGFIVAQLWEVFRGRTIEAKAIALPKPFVERLRQEAESDLRDASKKRDGTDDIPFLSDNDILTAWTTRTITRALKYSPSRPIAMINVLELRDILSDIIPTTHTYIGNLAVQVFAHKSAGELRNEPFGTTALAVRRTLEQQRTRGQVEGHIEAFREITSSKQIPMFGPWNMVIVLMSNWQKARLYEVDFSSAVVSGGSSTAVSGRLEKEGEKGKLMGRPSYIQCATYDSGMAFRNFTGLIGKDAEGTQWLYVALKKGAWREFERIARE